MENKQPKSLYERIIEILNSNTFEDCPEEGSSCEILNQSTASKAIRQLLIEEVGKAWDAGNKHAVWEECGTSSWEKPLDKEEYINQLNELK